MERARPDARPGLGLLLLPALILALGLSMTYSLWDNARHERMQSASEDLRLRASKIAAATKDRLNGYVDVLLGVAGHFDASASVSREEFHRYVEALRLGERYPGFQGVGFSVFIPASEKAEHVDAVRRDGFPDYDIRPPGERPYYTAVLFVEPFEGRNRRAFGYDMAVEPIRWAAALRARDRGREALSGMVTLQQEGSTDVQPGVVLMLPVYRPSGSLDTVEARRSNLLGWAYCPIRMHDLLRGVLQSLDFGGLPPTIALEVYDGDRPSPETRLFEAGAWPRGDQSYPPLLASERVDFGGRRWTLTLALDPRSGAAWRDDKATLIGVGGSAGTLLLALSVGAQTLSQRRIAGLLRQAAQTNWELAERERSLLWAQRIAQLGSWSYDPRDGQFAWSEGMFLIWGLDPSKGVPGDEERRRMMPPDDSGRLDDCLAAALANGEPFRLEVRVRRPDGEQREIATICTPHLDEHGRVVALSGTDQDVTERKRMQEALREQAIRDPLTGLLNRRYLDETLPRELGHCQRNGEPLVVAMLDIDHFKRFNDSYGHEAGDQALRAVGRLLRGFARLGDLVCRYGGEELTLILPGASPENAYGRLQELREAVEHAVIHSRGGPLPSITVSIGLAAARPGDSDAAALLSRADTALYRAKALGRNRVEREQDP